jgi:hypothetical protein
MVTKYVRKLTVVAMKLLILIIFYMQANDLAPASTYMSSPPVPLPYFSKVHTIEEVMKICLLHRVRNCESFKAYRGSGPKIPFETCVDKGFLGCLHTIVREKPLVTKTYDCAKTNCMSKDEKHIEKHSDVIYTRIP